MRNPGRLLLFALAAGGVVAAPAWDLPRIGGDLAGEVSPPQLHGAPPIRWKVVAGPPEAGIRRFQVTAEAPGLQLAATAELEDPAGEGRWELAGAAIDLSRWFAAAAPEMKAPATDLVVSGELRLSGRGVFHGRNPSGTVSVSWHNGAVRHPKSEWSVEGIEFDGEFAVDAMTRSVRSIRTATLRLGTITTNRFGARNLELAGRLKDLQTLLVESLRVEIAGGEILMRPCTVPLHPVQAQLDLQLTRVGLQDVAALVPGAVAEARGRVDGTLRLLWSEGRGLDLGVGRLVLRRDEDAQVRLMPSPGLITRNLPWYVLRFYPGLKKVENGELPIAAEDLEVTLTPQGDSEGRTAVVHLAGRPTDPANRAPVDMTVNVRAPLKTLIDFGTARGVHFKW